MSDKTTNPKTLSLDHDVNNDTLDQDLEELNQKDNSSIESPNERDDFSVSGSTPSLESDDDVLQNAHQMGIAPKADLEHPKELNIAKDVADAEEYLKTH